MDSRIYLLVPGAIFLYCLYIMIRPNIIQLDESNENKFMQFYNYIFTNYKKEIKDLKIAEFLDFLCFFSILAAIPLFLFILSPLEDIVPFEDGLAIWFIAWAISMIIYFFFYKNYLTVKSKNHLNKTKQKFNDTVIRKMLEMFLTNISIKQESSLSYDEYSRFDFDDRYDEFLVEEEVEGEYKGVHLNMHNIDLSTYLNNGRTQTVFNGLFIEMNSNVNIIEPFYIQKRKILSPISKLDNESFNLYYYITEEENAKKLLNANPDFVKFLCDIHINNIALYFENNKVYFKIECGDMFELPIYKKEFKNEYTILLLIFTIINHILEIKDSNI